MEPGPAAYRQDLIDEVKKWWLHLLWKIFDRLVVNLVLKLLFVIYML
jgi:hypothetical protein